MSFKHLLWAIGIATVLVLPFAPILPVSYTIEPFVQVNLTNPTKPDVLVYAINARKVPFGSWEMVAMRGTEAEALDFIDCQLHWFPLVVYDTTFGQWRAVDAKPFPCRGEAAPYCQVGWLESFWRMLVGTPWQVPGLFKNFGVTEEFEPGSWSPSPSPRQAPRQQRPDKNEI